MAYVAPRATLGEINAIVAWTLVRVGPEAMDIIESFLGRSVRDTIFMLLSWPEWNNGFALWECLESEGDGQAQGAGRNEAKNNEASRSQGVPQGAGCFAKEKIHGKGADRNEGEGDGQAQTALSRSSEDSRRVGAEEGVREGLAQTALSQSSEGSRRVGAEEVLERDSHLYLLLL